MQFKHFILYVLLTISGFVCAHGRSLATDQNGIYSVCEFGAKGAGQTIDTKAIQAAIDKAASEGGGVVLFPPGQYVSGSIILKDYVVLRFAPGAILRGSLNIKDYPDDLGVLPITTDYIWRGPLIYAENAKYIGIEGGGIIDGQGAWENFPPLPRSNPRPGLIRFKNCKCVTVKDMTLRHPACWMFHLRDCEDVMVRNVLIDSFGNRNNDGIDIDGGKRISIIGCNLHTSDDAVALKSYERGKISDIVISDCVISSEFSAIKIGTETVGDFENISISNCVIYGSRGINLFSVDGSDVNNVTISNISMRDCISAIQLRLGGRMRPYEMPTDQHLKRPGRVRNIMISNVQATGIKESQDFITGIPGYKIENVSLSNISISYYGNASRRRPLNDVPEEIKAYPKTGMFGALPSYGFYVRHVDGIRMNNIRLDFVHPDLKPAIVFDDVSDIYLSDCLFEASQSDPLIQMNNVSNAVIHDIRFWGDAKTFAGVSGKESKDIILHNNHINGIKLFSQGSEVQKNAVKDAGQQQ